MESVTDRLIREENAKAAEGDNPTPVDLANAEEALLEKLTADVSAGLAEALGSVSVARTGRLALGANTGALSRVISSRGAQAQRADITIEVCARAREGKIDCRATATYVVRKRPGAPVAQGECRNLSRYAVRDTIMGALGFKRAGT